MQDVITKLHFLVRLISFRLPFPRCTVLQFELIFTVVDEQIGLHIKRKCMPFINLSLWQTP